MIPPGPPPTLPGRRLLAFRRDPIGFLQGLAREYGDLVFYRTGPRHVLLVNEPELIKEVLVTQHRNFIKSMVLQRTRAILGEGLLTSEGEHHLRQRRLVQPAFHRQRIAAYGAAMVELADRARQRWRDGAAVDMHQEMMRLTLAVVGRTLFDTDVEGEADELGQALNDLMQLFDLLFVPFSALLERLPIPSTRRRQRAAARIDATIYRMIDERRKDGRDHGDLLSMLVMAQDEEGDGRGMTDRQVRDEAITIFLAGHETTANALTWTWYLLAQNPAAEAELHAELDRVLAGRPPAFEDLPTLRYTEMVLRESMRLLPPAWAVGREALAPFELGGYALPARTVVVTSQFITHRDPRWYPEPERFDPGRWTPEAQAGRPKFAYFPFGGGPRICVGESFAWMEGVLLLATLAQQWRCRLAPGASVELLPLITLRPKHGMPMIVERRQPAEAPAAAAAYQERAF
ncbi:MAG TPA: cytochrome P450 [Herpetosiphonaceae bacterium]